MEGIGERHALHVGGGRADGRVGSKERGKGIGAATTGEVEGYGSRGEVGGVGVGLGRECGPVVDGIGDDAGLVGGDEVSDSGISVGLVGSLVSLLDHYFPSSAPSRRSVVPLSSSLY